MPKSFITKQGPQNCQKGRRTLPEGTNRFMMELFGGGGTNMFRRFVVSAMVKTLWVWVKAMRDHGNGMMALSKGI
jgi:hypothetical protein